MYELHPPHVFVHKRVCKETLATDPVLLFNTFVGSRQAPDFACSQRVFSNGQDANCLILKRSNDSGA
ncbi:MAG: hypothetical protein HY318_00040 [Armatimonadetes bacterium]|nr:hypothetical protein [Armatimonadota bacterium]